MLYKNYGITINNGKLKQNINEVLSSLGQSVSKELKNTNNKIIREIFTYSQLYVPVFTGTLKKSGRRTYANVKGNDYSFMGNIIYDATMQEQYDAMSEGQKKGLIYNGLLDERYYDFPETYNKRRNVITLKEPDRGYVDLIDRSNPRREFMELAFKTFSEIDQPLAIDLRDDNFGFISLADLRKEIYKRYIDEFGETNQASNYTASKYSKLYRQKYRKDIIERLALEETGRMHAKKHYEDKYFERSVKYGIKPREFIESVKKSTKYRGSRLSRIEDKYRSQYIYKDFKKERSLALKEHRKNIQRYNYMLKPQEFRNPTTYQNTPYQRRKKKTLNKRKR